MPTLSKREQTSKPIRMDVRMARDLENLSDYTSYSQNDIILMAVRKYLYENRSYYVSDMVRDLCINRIDREVAVMREDTHLNFGSIDIDVARETPEGTDGSDTESVSDCFTAVVTMRNKHGNVFYRNEQHIDLANENEWRKYKTFLNKTLIEYVDLDDPSVTAYFRQKFMYE